MRLDKSSCPAGIHKKQVADFSSLLEPQLVLCRNALEFSYFRSNTQKSHFGVILDNEVRLNSKADILGHLLANPQIIHGRRPMKCYKRESTHLPQRAQSWSKLTECLYCATVGHAMAFKRNRAYARELLSAEIHE